MQAKLINGLAPGWVPGAAAATPATTKMQANTTDTAQSDVATLSPRARALQLFEQGDPASAIALILNLSVAQVNDYLRISGEQNQTSTAGANLASTVATGTVSHESQPSQPPSNQPQSAVAASANA